VLSYLVVLWSIQVVMGIHSVDWSVLNWWSIEITMSIQIVGEATEVSEVSISEGVSSLLLMGAIVVMVVHEWAWNVTMHLVNHLVVE